MFQYAHFDGHGAFGAMGDGTAMMGWGLHGFTSIIFMTLFLVAIVLVIRWLWRAGHPEGSNVLAILEERYAKGGIDRDEFLAKKKDMT